MQDSSYFNMYYENTTNNLHFYWLNNYFGSEYSGTLFSAFFINVFFYIYELHYWLGKSSFI